MIPGIKTGEGFQLIKLKPLFIQQTIVPASAGRRRSAEFAGKKPVIVQIYLYSVFNYRS